MIVSTRTTKKTPTPHFTSTMEELHNIKRGQEVCYYEGYTPCSSGGSGERENIFNKAHNLYNMGRVVLVQQRVENDGIFGAHVNRFRYLARGK